MRHIDQKTKYCFKQTTRLCPSFLQWLRLIRVFGTRFAKENPRNIYSRNLENFNGINDTRATQQIKPRH